jgi:VanZ family protein
LPDSCSPYLLAGKRFSEHGPRDSHNEATRGFIPSVFNGIVYFHIIRPFPKKNPLPAWRLITDFSIYGFAKIRPLSTLVLSCGKISKQEDVKIKVEKENSDIGVHFLT